MLKPGLADYQEKIMIPALVLAAAAAVLLVLIIATAVFVKLSRELCVRRLEYRRYFKDEGVFEGEETEFIEEFTNHSFVPMFVVDVETHIVSKIKMKGCESDDDLMQRFISRFFVMPFTRIRRTHKAVCTGRGYYRLESAKITFAGVEVYLDSRADIHVYPREISFQEQRNINSCLQYSAVSKYPLMEDRFSFAGVRKYIAGDPMSYLNYKQTARRGELMVNDREYMLGRKILLYLNFQPNEQQHFTQEEFQELIEKELSYASYMLSECVRNGYVYSLHTNSKMPGGDDFVRNPFATGEKNYQETLCQMAEMTNLYGVSMVSLIDRDLQEFLTGTEIFLFTSYVDETLEQCTERLERSGNAVNLINILEW